MKKLFLLVLLIGLSSHAAQITVSPWSPIFQGIDLASGQQIAQQFGEKNQQTLCLRVDLTNPDIKLFTTPKCNNCGNYETLAENTSLFLEKHKLQVAINGAFYASSLGPNDVPLNTPEDVLGLGISEGDPVSANQAGYLATLLFTQENQVFYLPTNSPATNLTGIYTAIAGSRALLVRGVNVNTPNPADYDPRTAFGLSQDRRYLYLMTLDGRQPGWSDGADFYGTGEWLLRYGAFDGINVDGGGSTTMVREECGGSALRLNRSSFVAAYGRERIIGHNFGIWAKPLGVSDKRTTVIPSATTATITWQTDFPGDTQVQYGPTESYGSSTAGDSRLTHKHVATLSGLAQGVTYYFRVISQGGSGETFSDACHFSTVISAETTEVFGLTKAWRYTTNNLDGVNWTSLVYDDSNWMGPGPGLLTALETSLTVGPKNTILPPTVAPIFRTYYFRTRFNFSGSTAGLSLTFSNYVDDGAVFYLNGTEVHRLRMPGAPTVINNATAAIGSPCAGTVMSGDANTTCPDVFTISGSLMSSLVQGENVVAVETHNLASGNDLVFGGALLKSSTATAAPALNLWMEDDVATLFWNGEGFFLQKSTDLGTPQNWSDLPGPVTNSPFSVTNGNTTFYRLRN